MPYGQPVLDTVTTQPNGTVKLRNNDNKISATIFFFLIIIIIHSRGCWGKCNTKEKDPNTLKVQKNAMD